MDDENQDALFDEAELHALLTAGEASWVKQVVPHLLEQQRQSLSRPFLRPQFESDVARAVQTANSALLTRLPVLPPWGKEPTERQASETIVPEGQTSASKDCPFQKKHHRIRLNVGGHRFDTTTATLTKEPESMIAAMFSGRHELKEDDGCVFIDQDGDVFAHVLSYLRSTSAFVSPKCEVMQQRLLAAADYYQLNGLRSMLSPDDEDGEATYGRESMADRISFREALQQEANMAKADVVLRRRLKNVVAEKLKKVNFCRHSGGERHSLWAAVKAQFLNEEKEGIEVALHFCRFVHACLLAAMHTHN
jgi:hypothetical protein